MAQLEGEDLSSVFGKHIGQKKKVSNLSSDFHMNATACANLQAYT